MQWTKKQGAGSKGTWGKVGDEATKSVPFPDSDSEESDAMQDKFTQEVKSKIMAEKLASDELESEKEPPHAKDFVGKKKPSLIDFDTEANKQMYAECRSVIEATYFTSIHCKIYNKLEDCQKLFIYIDNLYNPYKPIIAKRLIQIALERGPEERKFCAYFLKEAFLNGLIRKEDIRRGLDLVYIDFDQILMDNPHAIDYILELLGFLICDHKLLSLSVLSRIPLVLLKLQTYLLSSIDLISYVVRPSF
jgi:hypothetical protein